MSDENDSTVPLRAVIGNALANALSEYGDSRMILKHLVVLESLNERGERTVSVFTSEDARAWDIMGLAEWARGAAGCTQQAELMGGGRD